MDNRNETLETCQALYLRDLPVILVDGKNPGGVVGDNWQGHEWTLEEYESQLQRRPALNPGLKCNAPGTTDVEIDAPLQIATGESDDAGKPIYRDTTDEEKATYVAEALAEFKALCGDIKTPSWKSRRGIHHALATTAEQGDALEAAGAPAVVKIGKLEIRGLSKTKTVQSVIPPGTTDGFKREWIVSLLDIAPTEMPAPLFAAILAAVNERPAKPEPISGEDLPENYGDRPGDIYNARTTWAEVLEPLGWTAVDNKGEDVEHWRRPGKSDGVSATTGHCGSPARPDCLYIFSDADEIAPLESHKTYTKFEVRAIVHHAGDFAAATSQLVDDGYVAEIDDGFDAITPIENNPLASRIENEKLELIDELRLARHVIAAHARNGQSTIVCYQHEWHQWDGVWEKQDDKSMRVRVYATCKEFLAKHSQKKTRQFTSQGVSNVLMAMQAIATVKRIGWVNGKGGQYLAFKNQILNLDKWYAGEVELIPNTPEYFDPHSLPYDLTATDDEPTLFLAKLREQFKHGEIDSIQEFGGLCMTADTRFQRVPMLIGPPRSFKGTFDRTLQRSIGPHNAITKDIKAFIGPHAMEDFPGKTLLSISDSRTEPKLCKSGLERILSISGEDSVNVNPKGKTQYTVKLVCKILFVANDIPDFEDKTGAMEARILPWETTVSFAGKEDTALEQKIMAEQNAITWWFLKGLRRLMANGRFTEPTNTLRNKFSRRNNPVGFFVADYCDVTGEAGDKIERHVLYDEFRNWCEESDAPVMPENVFFRELYKTNPRIRRAEYYVTGITKKE